MFKEINLFAQKMFGKQVAVDEFVGDRKNFQGTSIGQQVQSLLYCNFKQSIQLVVNTYFT